MGSLRYTNFFVFLPTFPLTWLTVDLIDFNVTFPCFPFGFLVIFFFFFWFCLFHVDWNFVAIYVLQSYRWYLAVGFILRWECYTQHLTFLSIIRFQRNKKFHSICYFVLISLLITVSFTLTGVVLFYIIYEPAITHLRIPLKLKLLYFSYTLHDPGFYFRGFLIYFFSWEA